jgi:hypothetical protein
MEMGKKYRKMLFDLADSVSMNEDAVNEYLQGNGIDINPYLAKAMKKIKRKEFIKKAEENISKHQRLLSEAIKIIRNAVPDTLSGIEEAIRLKNPSFQFRNLKELDDQQLQEILNDVDLIKTIEDLDNKEKR